MRLTGVFEELHLGISEGSTEPTRPGDPLATRDYGNLFEVVRMSTGKLDILPGHVDGEAGHVCQVEDELDLRYARKLVCDDALEFLVVCQGELGIDGCFEQILVFLDNDHVVAPQWGVWAREILHGPAPAKLTATCQQRKSRLFCLMRKKPEILGVSTIAQTRIFRVEQIDVRFANGRQARYERVYATPPVAVMIVPLLDKDTVLLIREYAVGVERYELSLPKGRVDEGEDIFAAANRELMEEVGYGASSLQHIKSLSLAPGYVGHTTHVLLASDLYPQRRVGDEPEAIEVLRWPLHRVSELWHQSDCTEARSIAALFMVREHLASATRQL